MERDGQAIVRLREYLVTLPSSVQARLVHEFEHALTGGEQVEVASFVLAELRKIAARSDEDPIPANDSRSQFFRVLEPFLIERADGAARPGRIRQSSLAPVWMWLRREAMRKDVEAFETILAQAAGDAAAVDRAVRGFQRRVAALIATLFQAGSGDKPKLLARVGAPEAIEDLELIGVLFRHREAFETLHARLPRHIRELDESHVVSVLNALEAPAFQSAQTLPPALWLVMRCLGVHWQIIRLAIAHAHSDDAQRVAVTLYGAAVTMVLDDVVGTVGELMDDLRRGRLDGVSHRLKIVHDALRGLRTELDTRQESGWGRQLAAIRTTISNGLTSEIESVPGRVRRILRHRADRDINPGLAIDATEVGEVAALIDFVAVCRNFASEIAINEVTLRTFTGLQQYLETATRTLVESLRSCESRTLSFRRAQADAGIKFCAVLFGTEYAALLNKAADVALASEHKAMKAG